MERVGLKGEGVINIWLYNHVFINIILSMPYKYNLSDVFKNVFLESFSEIKNLFVEERMCEAEVKKSASLIVMPI